MIDARKQSKAVPVAWSPEIEKRLGEALAYDSRFIKSQVESGTAFLWCIDNGRSYMVTRIENTDDPEGKTLMIVCYAGKDLHLDMPLFLKAAQTINAKFVKFCTKHRGLPRLVAEAGYPLELMSHIFEFRRRIE